MKQRSRRQSIHWLRGGICGIMTMALLFGLTGCYTYEEVPVSGASSGTSGSTAQTSSGSVVEGEDSMMVSEDSSSGVIGSSGQSTQTTKKGQTTAGQIGGGSGSALSLISAGKANCTIVIAKAASEKVRAAAEDLQQYLNKICGATIMIGFDDKDRSKGNYILVGPSSYTKKLGVTTPTGYPGTEKVILKRKNNYLVLLGNDSGAYTGTQFAVTMFLEKLGCGWFGTDALWQVTPGLKNISVGNLDIAHTPKFNSRRTNVFSSYKEVAMRWYQGGNELMTGHGLPAMVPKTTFATHPEWFSLINGKRTVDATWWQYCYSNRQLASEVGKQVIAYFDKNPNAVSYPIIANDGWETDWCECDECAKYPSDADLMLAFANRVAKVVATKYPTRRLQLLSYHSTYTAPKLSTKAEPNVEIMFCKETGMYAPISSGVFTPGRDSITHNTYTMSWKDNFSKYISQTGVKNISVWVWYCLSVERPVWKEIPWVQGNVAIEDQNYWKSKGASYVFYDHGPLPAYRETSLSFPLRWPLWYVAAKGEWDASLTGDAILSDACSKLYGKAGSAMLAYYQALANASKACTGYSMTWIPCDPGELYTAAQVKKIDAAVAAAQKLKSSLTADQAKRLQITLDYWNNAKSSF